MSCAAVPHHRAADSQAGRTLPEGRTAPRADQDLRVLAHQGVIAQSLHGNDPLRGPRPDTLATVPPSWLAWAQRWRALSTHEPGTIRGMFSVILIAGRWAAEKHPEALEPHLWTRDIAAEYASTLQPAGLARWPCGSDAASAARFTSAAEAERSAASFWPRLYQSAASETSNARLEVTSAAASPKPVSASKHGGSTYESVNVGCD